jgi:hypothetical protein
MKRQTATNTPPPTQNVKVIVSSIDPQFEAMSVQYQGVKTWNKIDPRITKKNIIPGCIAVYIEYKPYKYL